MTIDDGAGISNVLSDARRDTVLRRCGRENRTPSLGRGAVSDLHRRFVLAPSSIAQLAFGCGRSWIAAMEG